MVVLSDVKPYKRSNSLKQSKYQYKYEEQRTRTEQREKTSHEPKGIHHIQNQEHVTLLNIPLTETQPQGKLERWYAQVTYRYRNLHELRKDAKHL